MSSPTDPGAPSDRNEPTGAAGPPGSPIASRLRLLGAIAFLFIVGAGALALFLQPPAADENRGIDPEGKVQKLGTVEVTARLIEMPKGPFPREGLYKYVLVHRYEVLKVHRGEVDGNQISVGHFQPEKPRSEAADDMDPDLGGTLQTFRAGDVHRMALEVPLGDHYIGAKINNDLYAEPIYWAVVTNRADQE